MYVYPLFNNSDSSYDGTLVDQLAELESLIHQDPTKPMKLPEVSRN